MKCLISGIPGTGKTSVGVYLHAEKKYTHIDLEDAEVMRNFSQSPEAFIIRLTGMSDVVVTGGFKDTPWAYAMVTLFVRSGFTFIWFDGNRPAARKAFVQRNTAHVRLFDEKIFEVDAAHEKIVAFHPRYINTFNDGGHFKELERIVSELES